MKRQFAQRLILGLLPILALASAFAQTSSPAQPSSGVVLTINGPIGPATRDYVVQGLTAAERDNAALVLLQIDTPGGLDQSMRDMIKAILASSVPVIAYVAPGGARAASAGTYILYAAHVAAMAPATNLGAATPVSLGGGAPGLPDAADKKTDKDKNSKEPAADNETAKRRKLVNDAVAYIRGLAEKRGRNADWAEDAVRAGVSISAAQAARLNVIDLVADNQAELLQSIDGRTVSTAAGAVILNTSGLTLQAVEPDWRMRLLAIITNPTVAYILMMIGIYGLILEGYSPGAMLPGIVGAISLLLALFAFQIIPVNFAGLGLLILGVALMVGEAFAPSFGVLGLGGIVAFVFGSIMLMETGVPGYSAPLAVIGAVAATGALLMFLVIGLFIKSGRQRVTTGREGLLNASAQALDDFDENGWVLVHGERWQAVSNRPVRAGQMLRITAINGLSLKVEPE